MMKQLFLLLFFCSTMYSINTAGIRNLVLPLDWGKETLARELKDTNYRFQNKEFGPVTQTLLAGLHQQAAPIIVSSSTWRNAVERGKIFKDIIEGRDVSYLMKYPMLSSSQNLTAFVNDIRKNYYVKGDVMHTSSSIAALEYYTCYQTFFAKNPAFKPQEWISKKVSEYLYLLIPRKYMQIIEQRKDTPAIGRQLTTSLTPGERLVGLKYEQLEDIPVHELLDPEAHQQSMQYGQYKKLVPAHSYKLVERLRSYKWEKVLNGYMFGQHVVKVLPEVFVTHSDVRFALGDKEETDLNEALFLHQWLVYVNGHGSISDSGPVMPIVYDIERMPGMKETRSGIAFTAGLEQGAFREMLGFFNNRVRTGSLTYTSCYSGGPHLFKLFEHHWDYPRTARAGKRIKVTKYTVASQDIFNYLIIATNLFYEVTTSGIFAYSGGRYYTKLPDQRLKLANYFNGMARFLHPDTTSKKPQTLEQQLATIIRFIHSFNVNNRYQIPAVRFPYTEWFVPLNDPGMRLRLETEQDRRSRSQQEAQARTLLQTMLQEKELPKKVQESRAQQQVIEPDQQKREKERKEKELFERMEKMRKEQAARAKENQKPKEPPAKPQPVKPSVKMPLQELPTQPQIQLPPPVKTQQGKKPFVPVQLPPPPATFGAQPKPAQTNGLVGALNTLENALNTMRARLSK